MIGTKIGDLEWARTALSAVILPRNSTEFGSCGGQFEMP